MTGAAGGIGTFLRYEYKKRYQLRLFDMGPIKNCRHDEECIQT